MGSEGRSNYGAPATSAYADRESPRSGGSDRSEERGGGGGGGRRFGGGGGGGGGGRGRFGSRRKVCQFCVDKVDTVDYKDGGRLRRFISDRGKIEPRRKTGTCARHQRRLTIAIKRARHLALLPYTGSHAVFSH